MVTQTINLDIVPNGIPPVIHISQYDTGERTLKFNIVSSAESMSLTGATVKISGVKPDGHGFEYNATFSNGVVTASVTEQMSVVAGKVQCALTFTTSNGIAQTARFDLMVKPSPLNDETIISDTEIPEIIALAREQEANARRSAEQAATSATNAATSEANAASSEANAATSETNAASSASAAATSESNASDSEDNAATSETNAAASATAAASSASNAATSEQNAAGWCDNNGDSGDDSYSATNNAYYWAMHAQSYATGALHWMGSITFANIPTSHMAVGDMYDITNEFTTDNRFNVGAGIVCPAGTNIIWSNSDKWDIQAPPYKASQISYSNATSGLHAGNVQDAINEVNDNIPQVDATLDNTSTNPLQNKVIADELGLKQDKTDNNLQTTSKNVVGAINEVDSSLTALSNAPTYASSDLIGYRKVGCIVEAQCNGDGIVQNQLLGTLPAGYRPSRQINVANGGVDNGDVITIKADGRVEYVSASSGSHTCRFHTMFKADA